MLLWKGRTICFVCSEVKMLMQKQPAEMSYFHSSLSKQWESVCVSFSFCPAQMKSLTVLFQEVEKSYSNFVWFFTFSWQLSFFLEVQHITTWFTNREGLDRGWGSGEETRVLTEYIFQNAFNAFRMNAPQMTTDLWTFKLLSVIPGLYESVKFPLFN